MPREPERVNVHFRNGFKLNPSHPEGGKHFDRNHILYVFSTNDKAHAGLHVIAATRWLRNWQPGARPTVEFGVNKQPVTGFVRGIVKCSDMTTFGHVPNVPVQFWTVV